MYRYILIGKERLCTFAITLIVSLKSSCISDYRDFLYAFENHEKPVFHFSDFAAFIL